jgi:hypothetical protein
MDRSRVFGGGTSNDDVFTNVTAKTLAASTTSRRSVFLHLPPVIVPGFSTPARRTNQRLPRKRKPEECYRKFIITMVNGMPSGTIPGATMDDLNNALDPTTDWLSFFLMTIGVFQQHIFSSETFIPSFFSLFFPPSRLVYLPYVATKPLARRTLGTPYSRLATRNYCFERDAAGQSPILSTHLHRLVSMPERNVAGLATPQCAKRENVQVREVQHDQWTDAVKKQVGEGISGWKKVFRSHP